MSRSAAIRSVTADIFKGALFFAAWTCFRWGWCLKGIAAFQALPKRIHFFCLGFLCFFSHNFTIYLLVLPGLFQDLEPVVPGASIAKDFSILFSPGIFFS